MSGQIYAQDSETTPTESFRPFVSNIATSAIGNRVTVTWDDIRGLSAVTYRVYRSRTELFAENISSAEVVANIASGIEKVEDVIDSSGSYYYAILAVDPSGIEVPVFIPAQNKTLTPIELTLTRSAVTFSLVSDFRAIINNTDGVELSFTAAPDIRVTLLRSTSPILTADDILSTIQVATLDVGVQSYIDAPLPGIPYYYAALDYDIISGEYYIFIEESGQTLFVPGENTLRQAVELPVLATRPSIFRSRRTVTNVLPRLTLNQAISSGINFKTAAVTLPKKQPLAKSTRRAVDVMLQQIGSPPDPLVLPVILESEERTNLDSLPKQEQILAEIVSSSFLDANYMQSIQQLEDLLNMSVIRTVDFRIRFYYAQSLFFIGELEAAIFQFLYIQDQSPGIVKPWVNLVLKELSEQFS